MPEYVLDAKDIRKHFGGVTALGGADLSCRAGRITGLLGANGSGKSTMSKIITGVYKSDGGTVTFDNRVVAYRNPDEARRGGIAMVFQNLSLVSNLPVWQNIVLGSERTEGLFLDDQWAKDRARNFVGELLPDFDVERHVYELNPGEMQIVEIAKALSAEPKLLILDEPTAALEQAQVKNLFAAMRRLVERGVAIIFTSHRLWEVMEICDDIVIFRNGKNVASIDYTVQARDPKEIVSYITGEAGTARVSVRRSFVSDEPVLDVEKLNCRQHLRDVSFSLNRGEILGIGGLAGQGQHELMLALAGNYPGLTGRVTLNGREINLTRPSVAIKNSMLLVPGDRQLEGLFLKHSVYTNLIFPRLGLTKQPFFTPENRYRRESREVMDTLSIKAAGLDIAVNTLSGGNQQKVVVGKWLSFDINILLLADPAKGVDVGAKRDLYKSILDLVEKTGMSVILYASDNEELIDYCDRLLIMYEGEIVTTLTGDDINDGTIVAASMRVEHQGAGRT